MYYSKFASDIENMLATLRNSGLQAKYMDFFLAGFDSYCNENFPDTSLLTSDIAEKWIHNTTFEFKVHRSRRV